MFTLPGLPYLPQKNQVQTVAMRGINYSDRIKDGDIADSLNISARRYPYIATRRGREKLAGYSGATALSGWGKLVVIQNGNLFYDGERVGSVEDGEKQFAVVNTKLVIFPDKKYLDLTHKTLNNLGAVLTNEKGATFTTDSVTLKEYDGDLTKLFKAGDGVTLIVSNGGENQNVDFIIKGVTEDTITVTSNTFVAEECAGVVTITRKIPDLDYICESENRLWGCNSKEQTIYCSALGDPTNFNVFQGLSTDSYALAVGTEGDFTGCCKLSSSVLFWKENGLHKILGSFPAEYAMNHYTIEGLRKGCHKSMQVINEVLFYVGAHGVFAFSGSTPTLISDNFGEKEFASAVAGNDGDSYFLSCCDNEGKWHLLVYETSVGIWVHEDNIQCIDFARVGKELYFLEASCGEIYRTSNGKDEENIPWYIQFVPFYETIEGKKSYSKLLLRLELPVKSYLTVSVRQDEGAWREIGQVVGNTTGVARVRIPISRCDKFQLRLDGKGPCTILSMLREFSVGGEV